MSLLQDVLPGEESEEKFRLLVGFRRTGHDEVRAWCQPQLPTHFLFFKERLRPAHGSIGPEELRRQSSPVIIVLWVGDRMIPAEVVTLGW